VFEVIATVVALILLAGLVLLFSPPAAKRCDECERLDSEKLDQGYAYGASAKCVRYPECRKR
jgi:hypothetical protein